jgi:hypothetical protein
MPRHDGIALQPSSKDALATLPAASVSACGGTTEVVLYPYQSLTQPQAAAFCKAAGGSLVNGDPLVLAAAQGLVKQSDVSVGDRAEPNEPAFACLAPVPRSSCVPSRHAHQMHRLIGVVLAVQLTDPPGVEAEGWSAAAWIGISKASSGAWSDSRSPVSTIPWCPGEPNNLQSNESCSNLMTGCAPGSPTALVNDYACDKPARVLCMAEGAARCAPGACFAALSK